MRLGGICGSFNRAFDAGAVGVHNDFGVAEATWGQSEIATPKHFRRAGQSRADG